MRRLILVRHSTPKVTPAQHRADWQLSEEGIRKAEALGAVLAVLRPEVVATSPEVKAKQTAKILADAAGLPEARTVADLREHDDGSAPFVDEATFRACVASLFSRPSARVFGAESADEAYTRFAAAIAALPAPSAGGANVVVAHGRVISLFVSRTNGLDAFAFWTRLEAPSYAVLALPRYELQPPVPGR